MLTEDRKDTVQIAGQRRTSWLAWLAAVLLLLFAFGYFVVKPLAERAIQGGATVVGELLAAGLQGLQTLLMKLYDKACQRVEQSAEVQALVGEPVVCAPFEDCEWLGAKDNKALEFKFRVSGPAGEGEAHVVAVPADTGFEIKSVEVTGPDGTVARLPEP